MMIPGKCFRITLCWTSMYAHTVYPKKYAHGFALLCYVVVIHWLIFPYPSGLLHWHCGNLTIAPVPGKQPWWIWINTSCEFIMNDCITTTKESTTKPCAYFLGYTVCVDKTFDMTNKSLHIGAADGLATWTIVSSWADPLPDSNVHGPNMGPIWGRRDPGGPHVGPMNIANWAVTDMCNC